ncbi:cysteine desulfurase [Pseudoclavibacter endophyticus]|nr:cysteine desulfurase [Pseudoclavibacter endophyticus]
MTHAAHLSEGASLGTSSRSPRAATALSEAEVERVRADFPVLNQPLDDHRLIYLDSGATAQRPTAVLDTERAFLERDNGAVHRGAHTLAARSTEAFELARETVASFVGADADEIAWALNATDALGMIALGIDRASHGFGGEASASVALREGDEIVFTEAEHHANLVPWQQVAQSTGAVVRVVPVADDGTWTIDDLRAVVTDRTRVIAFSHISNVTGLIAPVDDVVAIARSVGAITVLDACQSAPHRPLDLHALGVDAVAFSAHKMLGPNGLGILYGRREFLAALPPARTGGSMITTVTLERSEFMDAPMRFEAGTQPVSQAVALAEAVRYLEAVGMDRVEAHEHELGERLAAGLSAIPGVRVLGPAAGTVRAGLASFAVDGVHAHDVTQFLDAEGIAARGGHHCAQPLHRRLGLTATTRASTYLYTSRADVDRLLDVLAGVRGYFGVGGAAS